MNHTNGQMMLKRPIRNDLAQAFEQERSKGELIVRDENIESTARLADSLLADALHQRASDIHLDPQNSHTRIRFRIDGSLLDVAILSKDEGGRLMRHFKVMSGLDTADHFRPADARLSHEVEGRMIDLRIACLPTVSGEKLSIRLLDRSRVIEKLDELGLLEEQQDTIQQWLQDTCGMFLVAGPTGSGKTTTLYSLLNELKIRDRCILTIEDPVEYHVEGIAQMQVSRRHGLTFPEGVKAMLRADPDVLLLGEIRDAESAKAAIEASGSGRVLLSTIHAPDAVSAVTTLRNMGIPDHQIATSLRIVVAQRLVRRLCRRCRRREKMPETDRQWLASIGVQTGDVEAWGAGGCDECRQLGYSGRVGIFEVWRLTDADYQAILSHADERTLRAGATARGLRPLLHDAWEQVQKGTTSMAELRSIGSGHGEPFDPSRCK